MTDAEIIKALELCSGDVFCHKGNGCPYQGVDKCIKVSTHDAIDLINRQQAEIERLEKHELRVAMTFNSDTIKRAVTEAVKEFAERLKEKAKMPLGTLYGEMLYIEDIDNLLKETAGDT